MKNKEKNFVSAVIYVHNAGERIEQFLRMVIGVLEDNFEKSEVVCVNDYSSDNSVEVIKTTVESYSTSMITVLNLSYYHGVEMSMNAGVDLAIGDFVLEFDSTILDFGQEDVMRVYHKSLEGYDIVSASPNQKQKLSSSLFYYVFNVFTDFSYEMYTERFRILSRRVINRISSINKTVPYRKAVYANCGLKTTNLKYNILSSYQVNTNDKIESDYRKKLAVDTLVLFTDVGYKFSMAMTFMMMFVTVAVAAYSLIFYMVSSPVEGWTTTILFLAFAFFGLFGILTIIIKYLQIIVDLIFKRKKYSVLSIDKL